MTQPKIFAFGEAAVVCEFDAPATLPAQIRIWAVAQAARQWPHVSEAVPGMNNLTVLFDPLAGNGESIAKDLAQAFERDFPVATNEATPSATIHIPVSYGGTHGPDLDELAHYTGLSAETVIELHTAAEYVVFSVGFLPGFAYLGGLDPRLVMPRLDSPRLRVPAGAVGIGGEQTGVYPLESPGGWRLIGHTDLRLFNPTRAEPSLLKPGDRVRFVVAGRS